jgi:thiamine biosynthesis lipoprotein
MGMCLDLDAIVGKHLVDRVVKLGHEMGVENLLVKHGRDVRSIGAPMGSDCWTIGIEDPEYQGLVGQQMQLNVCGGSTCGLEGQRGDRRGRNWSKVIDPRSGFPVDNSFRQVSVVAKSCLEAGLLATTAYALGPDEGMNLIEDYFGAEGVIVCHGREAVRSTGSAIYFN